MRLTSRIPISLEIPKECMFHKYVLIVTFTSATMSLRKLSLSLFPILSTETQTQAALQAQLVRPLAFSTMLTAQKLVNNRVESKT